MSWEWVCSLMAVGLLLILGARASGSKPKAKRPGKGSKGRQKGAAVSRSGSSRSRSTTAGSSGASLVIEYGNGGIRGEPSTSAQCWVPPGRDVKAVPGLTYANLSVGWTS